MSERRSSRRSWPPCNRSTRPRPIRSSLPRTPRKTARARMPGTPTRGGAPTARKAANVARPRPPRFGEEDRQLSYGSYLKLSDVLSSQHLISDPPAHDELLFIVIHQVYELWFKELLFELESVRAAMFEGDLPWARHLLDRAHRIERVLVEQI